VKWNIEEVNRETGQWTRKGQVEAASKEDALRLARVELKLKGQIYAEKAVREGLIAGIRGFLGEAERPDPEGNVPGDVERARSHAELRRRSLGNPAEGADLPDEEEESPDIDLNAEADLQERLIELLKEVGYIANSFEHAGILTRNYGVVIRPPRQGTLPEGWPDSKFQITIVEDRRG